MKILVVDDDSNMRELCRLWLKREGFDVFEAANGLEAMRVQRKSVTDVIICDLIMPIQEGIETIAQLQAEFPQCCIIAISGGGKIGSDSYLVVAEQLGAWKSFTKPINMPSLIQAINEWKTLNRIE